MLEYINNVGSHTINSFDFDQLFIIFSFVRDFTNVLLGGKRISGDWTWTSGMSWLYTGWSIGQPNTLENIVRYHKEGNNRGWASGEPDNSYPFLCQFDKCPNSK